MLRLLVLQANLRKIYQIFQVEIRCIGLCKVALYLHTPGVGCMAALFPCLALLGSNSYNFCHPFDIAKNTFRCYSQIEEVQDDPCIDSLCSMKILKCKCHQCLQLSFSCRQV